MNQVTIGGGVHYCGELSQTPGWAKMWVAEFAREIARLCGRPVSTAETIDFSTIRRQP